MIFGTTVQSSVECVLAFVVRNSVSFYALENIRSDLDNLINRIALPFFGPFATPIIARELACVFSVPCTCFFAEIVAVAVKETIRAVVDFVSDYFGFAKPKGLAPFMREQALAIAGFTAGFFAKSYFCNYAMQGVFHGCKHVIRHAVTIAALPFPFSTIMPQFAVIAAPYITFALGDIVWTVVSEATQELLDNALDMMNC